MAGLYMTTIYAVIVAINQYLYHVAVHPEYFDLMLEHAAERAEAANDPAILEYSRQHFTTANYVFQVFIGAAIFGTLVSLIGSIFLKKK